MKNLPKISIVTPSYNQGEFLERTIQSVINQGYPNLEYIIIDGGSTDNSVEIIKKYSRHLTYWVSEKDDGQTQAINKGFRMVTGDIVAWLNSDDEYCPGTFETIAEAFGKYPDTDFVFGNRLSVDSEGKIIRREIHTKLNYAALWGLGLVLSQPSSFWRRSGFDKFGYLDESLKFCMDFEFFIRICGKINCMHINRTFSLFRWHKDSKSSTIQQVRLQERKAIQEKYRDIVCHGRPVWFVLLLAYMYRAFSYTFQGNCIYVVKGVIRRLLPESWRPRWL